MSPELQTKIQQWRQRAMEGTLTKEEMAEAIKLLREDRVTAVTASAKVRTQAKTAIPSADDLLAELGL